MQKLPDTIELSCLPMFIDNKAKVELSLSSAVFREVEAHFEIFVNELNDRNITYKLL